MMIKKKSKFNLKQAIFGFFFAIMGLFSLNALVPSINVYAESDDNTSVQSTEQTNNNQVNNSESNKASEDNCKKELGELGWWVCPSTGKIAQATDWLYEKIEDILVISPVSMEDGTPIYEVWKYCRGLTNIVFIIFLLVVIYSQVTGLGLSNYGIKKVLPKLIIAAVLVNMSFLVCSFAVDISNVVGSGLRGFLATIAESAMNGKLELSDEARFSLYQMYTDIKDGLVLGGVLGLVGGVDSGMIWMLIPIILGGVVAVASGLITIALRQAVVALLIMISPLAMVAYMLPNIDGWFKKWKDLLFKMLVFYPMFSLLFGASNLAGFAIISSANDGLGVLLGMAIQIFPLFFSWSLMKMSGTFLGTINTKIRGLAAKPLAANRAWAESRRMLTKQKHLASGRAVLPSTRLMQYLSDRKIAREEESADYATTIKKRGLAYAANKNYKENGVPTKEGMEAYERQARNMRYDEDVLRHKNNMAKGLGTLEVIKANATTAERAKLDKLDAMTVKAADDLFVETVRGEKIQYNNAVSRHARFENAINAHMDLENGFDDIDGKIKKKYKFHFDPNGLADSDEMARYNRMKQIMEGNVTDTHFAAASAAQAYDTQKKIVETKMQKYFELTPATQDVVYRLNEWTNRADATKNIDSIVAGLRILNQRGDTDKVKQQLDNILEKNSGLMLGTHASQAIASFLMFEVKDGDPFLRRYGKYLNLETARVFDEGNDMRKEMRVTYDEYIKGYHEEPDGSKMVAKKSMAKLIEGTPLDNIERTAMGNLDDSLKKAYGYRGKDDDGNLIEWDVDGYLEKREELQTAFEPAFLSSSLKWLSGSEQMNSAVKFWTGYDLKQKKENGKAILQKDPETGELKPVYELAPVWEGEEFEGHKEQVKDYYKKKTRDYFKDQTTGQILGMRTDYRESTVEHLLDMYLNGVDRGELEESVSASRNAEYQAAVAEIQTRYADEPAHKAQKKREADIVKLKRELAGHQLRDILDKTGKLEQIYNTRRSGAANNAKDWLRKMLNLDDKDEIYRYLDSKNSKRSKETSATTSPVTGENNNSSNVSYGDTGFRTRVMAELWDIFDKTGDHGDADTDFYEESLDKITHEFGENSVVVAQYKEYKKYNSNASRGELWDELEKIMSNFFSAYD